MLYLDAVYSGTLGLLKEVMRVPDLHDFNLAGGTALALQIGHRLSVDLDFFGAVGFNADEILASIKTIEGIRLLSVQDVGAMKLAAIAGRGKKRDFYDIYFLLEYFSLKELINAYNNKYSDGSEFMVAKSLVYFEDAEMDEEPVLLQSIEWSVVKEKIRNEVYRCYR